MLLEYRRAIITVGLLVILITGGLNVGLVGPGLLLGLVGFLGDLGRLFPGVITIVVVVVDSVTFEGNAHVAQLGADRGHEAGEGLVLLDGQRDTLACGERGRWLERGGSEASRSGAGLTFLPGFIAPELSS